MKRIFLLLLLSCFVVPCVNAVSVTIYNDNMALVRDTKEFNLVNGVQKIEIDDVSAAIDPTSVLPKFLSDAGKIQIYEQNFDYDLVNTNKLLEKYIGSDIDIERKITDSKKEKMKVKLLAVNGGLVFQSANGILLNPDCEISLPKLPEGLKLKPTLSWVINSGFAGKNKMEVTYITRGISWAADYVLVMDKNDAYFDLNGWVTVNNNSGAQYKDADLQLVAGDINTVKPAVFATERSVKNKTLMMADANSANFEEKSFFDYYYYKLARQTTIKDNEQKQIEFISTQNVPFKKQYIYNGSNMLNFGFDSYSRTNKSFGVTDNKKVNVKVEIKNDKVSKLGIPLPKGKMRVYKNDGAITEFIGEDMIDHTAADGIISLDIGNAFDVTGERTQKEFKTGDKFSQESFEIVLKNSKDAEIEVDVVEPLYRWGNWRILDISQQYMKKDAKTIMFKVKVPAKSEAIVKYTVRYTW